MNRCFSTLKDIAAGGQPCVLVTVAHTTGSAPREAGARMIVTPTRVLGTIGGGNLEFEAVRIARSRLDEPAAPGARRGIELFPLGPMLQQCCGGAVHLHFEVLADAGAEWIAAAAEMEQNDTGAVLVSRTPPPFPNKRESGKILFTETGASGSLGDSRLDELAAQEAQTFLSAAGAPESARLHPLTETQSTLPDTSDALFFEMISPCKFRVALFGAGHVGNALVNILAGLPDCRITWVDNRAGQFPAALPSNVEARFSESPVAEAENLPGQVYSLVMTHDHGLDEALCEALLRRDDLAFLGLIGSATKRRRFAQRLSEKGISDEQLARLTCPIGIPGIESKEPGGIAVSVAAQLLTIKSAGDAD